MFPIFGNHKKLVIVNPFSQPCCDNASHPHSQVITTGSPTKCGPQTHRIADPPLWVDELVPVFGGIKPGGETWEIASDSSLHAVRKTKVLVEYSHSVALRKKCYTQSHPESYALSRQFCLPRPTHLELSIPIYHDAHLVLTTLTRDCQYSPKINRHKRQRGALFR